MSRKLESGYKGDIVKAINSAGGYATRVEDQYLVGRLDLVLSMPETGLVLAEAKRFTHKFFEPSPRQYVEMCRVDNGGGTALLIGIKGERYYLHSTNRKDHPRGRVYVEQCVEQRDDEKFPDTFIRWFKQRNSNV